MTRPVAAGEPSMEDILASIRKIIAEEPAATPASGSASAPFSVATSPVPPGPQASSATSAPPRASDTAPRGGEDQHKAGGSALFGRLSEALRGGSDSAPPQSAAAPRGGVAGLDDDLADMLAEPAPRSPASLPLRDAAAMRGSALPLPSGRRESPFGGPLVSAPPAPPASRIEPSFGAIPAPASRDSSARPADLGAFVPARPDAARSDAAQSDATRKADPAGAPPFGRRINESGASHDAPPPSPAPSAPPQVIAAMPAAAAVPASPPAAPASAAPATAAAERAASATAAREVKAAEVALAGPAAEVDAAGPTVIAAMPAAPPAAKLAAPESDPDTTAAAQSALSMLAKGLKASAIASDAVKASAAPAAAAEAAPVPAAQRVAEASVSNAAVDATGTSSAPVPRDASAMRVQSAVAATPAPIEPPAEEIAAAGSVEAESPAVAAEATVAAALPQTPAIEPEKSGATAAVGRDEPAAVASPSPAPSPQVTQPSAAGVGDVRTLEDTVAELLRPMLRQWLDDNMPRIVEKALRVEIAGRPAAPTKPKG